ncbi:MAG: BrnT family toxin [Deltaproteobacteria bacterium]|nr:BrnT family toxin [Deltaproteobacteria bacterium]
MMQDLVYDFDPEKSRKLKRERGISFEEIIHFLDKDHISDVSKHSNTKKYPHQMICTVNIDGYAYMVPFIVKNGKAFLKTIIPSRKATAIYLGSRGEKK